MGWRRAVCDRLVNRSGLRLSYWVDASGESFPLNPFEESALMVEPVEKSVIMPDSQQHVMARTICMQFEGNWTPVTDIIVDNVGKYAYTIGSPHDTSVTPVVMDVSLDIRTKVRLRADSLSRNITHGICALSPAAQGIGKDCNSY